MSKITEQNYQIIRRFMIVRMNESGLDSLDRARVLQMIDRHFNAEQLQAVADAISNRDGAYYRDFDLVHDIMGIAKQDEYFVPRITSIAEVY